ncbi:MAG: S8 family serine peptidase, partial [Nanoarchaeota archaeon]|nr:S8 family serine peptidase [Nanoarchaeota archaeon]
RYGDYTLNSELIDKIVINNASLLYSMSVVFSVGNERNLLANPCNGTGGNYNLNYPYKTIPTPHTAKNIITVGGVDSKGNYICDFSSYGPTDEERIKPELVSFGCEDMDDFVITSTKLGGGYGGFEGTSFAAPHVSGTIALMLEQWNKSGYTQDPLPSTIKALLLDSTTDLKQDGSGTQTIDGPDYINGFGLLNAKGAVDRIINGTFVEANLSEENNIDIYSLNITSQNQIKVTLVWDDVPGANLINDLDLKLISPSGTIFYPWVLNPDIPNASATRNNVSNLKDNVNNVEQVYINESEIETGEWLLVISATSLISYQKYSVVSEEELFTPLKFSLIDMFPFKTNGKNLIGNIDFQVSNITFNGSEGLFDGTSNYGSTESINFLPSTGSLSVWFKSDNINNNGIILGNTKIGTQDYFRIRERSGSSKYELIIGGESFVDTSSTRDNNWHNIILTWSPSDTWKYYFDGVNLHNGSSGKVPTSIYKTFSGVLNNGNVIYGPAPNYFYGSIKDIDLYEQVLSATDIQNLYTYETPSSTPQLKDEFKSLLFYYELNDNGTDFLTGLNLSISGVNFTGSNTDFDGINDYMKTSLGNGLENSGTLSVWFKSDNLSKDGIILGNTKIGYSDYLRIRERTGSYNYEIIISDEVYLDTSSTRDTNWHNIVLTWNSSNSWKYYFDNSLVHTGSSGEIPTSPYNIFYGVLNDGDSIYGPAPNYFDGQIRDVSIFAKQFSSSDLSLLYSVDSYSDLYE